MDVAVDPAPRQLASDDADWWRGAVIYQIYPRSYQDTNDDGVGDLAGITKRLAYIADLGVDAIWISPFYTSPMADFGYDVADYTAVDPIFGTLADFDALIDEAHRLGLRVLIDLVLSHSSDRHPWFVESRASHDNDKADWYVWADAKPDGSPPNNWLSVFGGPAWEWESHRRQYYLHNFLAAQPDLNLHNTEVQAALLDVVEFWLRLGVDGFRLDTTNFYFHSAGLEDNPPAPAPITDRPNPANPYYFQDHLFDKNQPENLDFLKRLRQLLDRYPGTTSVGEIGDGPRSLEIMAAYTSGGDKLHMCYTFDFLGPSFSDDYFRNHIEHFESVVADGWPCWSFSNHDVTRHPTRWADQGGSESIARLSIGILLSLRGSVCLYQGEELGLTEASLAFDDLVDPYGIRFWPEFKGRDGCRTPMVWEADAANGGFTRGKPWLPVPSEHLAMAVDRSIRDSASTLAHYKQLLAFRRAHPALLSGTIALVDTPPGVLAFIRHGAGEQILCMFNLGVTAVDVDLPSGMTVSPLGGHGLDGAPGPDGRSVRLAAADGFFGVLD